MFNLIDALNAEGTNIDPSVEKDPLVEATTEVNKANVVDTAQQTALDLAKQNAQKRVTLENQIDGIKKSISNLQNQLVEIDQEINNFNKPMSDEEIMRIGEQLNVPEVATNYINARSGRLNREFEAKKYDVAKDESKKTRKEGYESSMRNLTTEINLLNDRKRKAAESDKSGIDVEIAGKQNELNDLNDKYSKEFGTSFLDSIKVDETSKPISTETAVENTESIVPQGEGWGWGVDESTLNTTEQGALQEDVNKANEAIYYVNSKSKSSYPSAITSVIADIKRSRQTWSDEMAKTALKTANDKAEADQDAKKAKKLTDTKELQDTQSRYDSAQRIFKSKRALDKDKAAAKKIIDELAPQLKILGGKL